MLDILQLGVYSVGIQLLAASFKLLAFGANFASRITPANSTPEFFLRFRVARVPSLAES